MSKSIRALVVDDVRINREVLIMLLRSLGVRTDEAPDGKTALSILNQSQYEVVFLDLQMPEMDGFEVCQKIREMPVQNAVRIVAVTAHTGGDWRQRCLDASMDEYIAKPVRRKSLTETLKQLLNFDATVSHNSFVLPEGIES